MNSETLVLILLALALVLLFFIVFLLAVLLKKTKKTGVQSGIAQNVSNSAFEHAKRYPGGTNRDAPHRAEPGELELLSAFVREHSITKREREVIEALLTGKSNQEISESLFVTVKTIEVHLSNIYRKTGAQNRFALYTLIKNKGKP
jgi:DNA-binding NarL/FixJ family response regulator